MSGAPDDPFLDRALDSLATTNDVRLRRVAAAQVDARLAEDTPAVFLYAPEVTFMIGQPCFTISSAMWSLMVFWTRDLNQPRKASLLAMR